MGKGQFIINTGHHCFLCLGGGVTSKVGGQGPGGDGEVRNIFSFQNICQYLKLSLRDVLAETISVTSASLPHLENSELKGTFCPGCALLVATFSARFLEVEVAQMKLRDCLKSVYERMAGVGNGGGSGRETLEQFRKEMLGRPETLAQYGVVEQLRRKTLERCSRKLSTAPPRVVIGKLSDVVIMPSGGGVKKEVHPPDLSLLLPPLGHQYLGQGPYQKPLLDIEEDPNSCMVECDVCHLKVSDLFAHFSTAHMEMQGVVVEEPQQWQGMMPPLPPPLPPTFKGVTMTPTPHLGKRGPECDLCGRTFTTRGSLNRHRRNFHFAKILKTSEKILLDAVPSSSPQFGGPTAGSFGLPPPTYSKPEPRPITGATKALTQIPMERDTPSSSFNPGTGLYQCVLCPRQFSSSGNATVHYNSEHLKIRYECSQCSKEFSMLSSYNRHHRTVHGVTGADTAGVKSNIDKVIETLHENKALTKQKQKRSGKMNNSSPVKRGRGRPGRGRPRLVEQKCDLCGMKFKLKEILLRHQRIFHRQKVPKGGSTSSTPVPLNYNGGDPQMNSFSDPGEGPPDSGSFPPNIHDKPLPSRGNSKRDLTTLFTFNADTGRPQCNLCLKEFTTPSNVGVHYDRAHLNLTFDCDQCEKKFKDKNTLTDHQNIHNGIRFSCPTCSRSFNTKRQLGKHRLRGSCVAKKKKKPAAKKVTPTPMPPAPTQGLKYTYRCSTCGSGFTDQNQLIEHFRAVHLS